MTIRHTASSAAVMSLGRSGLSLWLAALVGRYQLRRMQQDGLPKSLHSPFLFLLNWRLGSEDYQVVRRIEGLRSEMAKRENEVIGVFSDPKSIPTEARHSLPADSPQGHVRLRSLTQVAYVSSVLPQWGTFLHLCANATGAKTILELGTSAGISGCYLASGKHCQRFITIEGWPDLARLAETHLRQVANNFEVLNASFSEALEKILPTLKDGIDMAYIDGGKDKLSILRYFECLTPYLNNGCIVVFDDIHWSLEMWNMWETVSRWKGFSYTINAGRFGVCVWIGGAVHPKTYDLYKVAGVDLFEVNQFFEGMRKGIFRIRSRPGHTP
jgi:predicted O-methyltransferase YrrM